jgi:hypothetical protein
MGGGLICSFHIYVLVLLVDLFISYLRAGAAG